MQDAIKKLVKKKVLKILESNSKSECATCFKNMDKIKVIEDLEKNFSNIKFDEKYFAMLESKKDIVNLVLSKIK